MSTLTPVPISYHQDALAIIAECILKDQQQQLPRLNKTVVIIPDYQARHRLLRLIATGAEKLGYSAILPPQISTLKDYIEKNYNLSTATLPAEQRSLVLLEALRQHQQLFNHANLWTATDALLQLFDQLTLYQSQLPDDLNAFIRLLESAYGCNAIEIKHLGQEATLIHTLWRAWHQQLDANGIIDSNTAYLIKLANAIKAPQADTQLYIVRHQNLLPAEQLWLNHCREDYNGCEFFFPQDDNTQPSIQTPATSIILDRVFTENSLDLRQRTIDIKNEFPKSPIDDHIKVFKANSFEEEVKAISLQIRQWRLENVRRVGLVIEDRQLARRIRALLERANIALRDAGGWALSTTSAAALLESWLEAIEEDFSYQSLLTVIKTPNFLNSTERLQAVFHLEYDIIRREKITRGIDRYRHAIRSRLRRQQLERSDISDQLFELLNLVESAALPINNIIEEANFSAEQGIQAITESIRSVGLHDYFQQEPAGQEILQLLEDLTQVAKQTTLRMNWEDLRTWFSRNLEQRNFKPVDEYEEYVDLLHLPQTELAHYEGVIIGGLTSDHFPGAMETTPFFNSQVKNELGLPHWQIEKRKKLKSFRRLLESAPNILLSVNTGGDKPTSPWLDLLCAFHSLAYQNDLSDASIRDVLNDKRSEIHVEESEQLYIPNRPHPSVPETLLPQYYSASSHQKLIDCPYAFFAANTLGLQAPEEVREMMAKNEYGSRVHLCIQAFHQDISYLPGPFAQKIEDDNKQQAISMMNTISEAVFAKDLEQNFLHRGWLKRWQRLIPKYIDWQQKREQSWTFSDAELRTKVELDDQLVVMGRIDRLDQGVNTQGNISVIDFKTGYSPKQDETLNGESVQLAHYVLSLSKPVDEALYLQLDQDKLSQTSRLENDELKQTAENNRERLQIMNEMIRGGSGLPAWGDESVCKYCQMKGLCRYNQWQEEPNGGPEAA